MSPLRRLPVGAVAFLVCATVTSGARAAKSTLVLRWEAVPGAKEYALEIAEDRRFKRIVLETRVPHAAYRFMPPSDEVSYFFRVAAVDNQGRLGRFSPAKAVQQVLATPTARDPADGAVVHHGEAPPTVTLAWAAIPHAAAYLLEVARSRAFAGASTRRVDQTSAAWTPPGLGTFFWRVAAVDRSGLAGRPSLPRAIHVKLAAPRLNRPSGGVVAWAPPKTAVQLRWGSGPAVRFEVQVADDARFRQRLRRLSSKSRATTVELSEPGTFHWRVRGIDAAGRRTPWSAARFELREPAPLPPPPPPPPPRLVAPEPDAHVAVLAPGAPIDLTWESVEGASSYEAELATSETFADAQRSTSTVPRTTVTIATTGESYWRVRVVGGKWSEVRRLSAQPLARRAEMASRAESPGECTVVVTAMDADGAGVPGLNFSGSATAGVLGAFDDRGDGSYVATWNGEGQAIVTVVDPFGLEASTPVESWVDSLFLGARAGVLTNFSADTSPRLWVHGSYTLPWWERQLFAIAAVGYAYSHKSFEDVVAVSADLHRIPITLGVGYRHPFSSFEAFATAGVAVDPFVATVALDNESFANESGVIAGADVAGGVAYPLGPGHVFVELAVRATSTWEGLVSVGGVGVSVAVGYELVVR